MQIFSPSENLFTFFTDSRCCRPECRATLLQNVAANWVVHSRRVRKSPNGEIFVQISNFLSCSCSISTQQQSDNIKTTTTSSARSKRVSVCLDFSSFVSHKIEQFCWCLCCRIRVNRLSSSSPLVSLLLFIFIMHGDKKWKGYFLRRWKMLLFELESSFMHLDWVLGVLKYFLW